MECGFERREEQQQRLAEAAGGRSEGDGTQTCYLLGVLPDSRRQQRSHARYRPACGQARGGRLHRAAAAARAVRVRAAGLEQRGHGGRF